jgi:hypothetical protein
MAPAELALSVIAELDELINTETNRARHIKLVRIRTAAAELAEFQESTDD